MSRSLVGLFVLVGSTAGGLVPTLLGASAFGLASFAGGIVGAVAGVFAAARLAS